jgi:hypothetical protein
MTVPNDVLRFEILLYVSLLLDVLSAAFLGVGLDEASGAASPSMNLFAAAFFASLLLLVWLAARRQKNWARWSLLAFFALSAVLAVESIGRVTFGARTFFDILSFVPSAAGFYYAFTPDAARWFRS